MSPKGSVGPTMFHEPPPRSSSTGFIMPEPVPTLETVIKHIKAGNIADFNKEAQRLVAAKVSLNNTITGGWTCLHYAAYLGRTQIVTTLLQTLWDFLMV